jgi:Na+/Pi-cotransporter
VNTSTVALEVVGGLVLFLFGVLQLSRGIEPLAGERARELLSRFTTNPLAGVLTGAVATTILDSSSVTIILVIALVNGGLLTFQRGGSFMVSCPEQAASFKRRGCFPLLPMNHVCQLYGSSARLRQNRPAFSRFR